MVIAFVSFLWLIIQQNTFTLWNMRSMEFVAVRSLLSQGIVNCRCLLLLMWRLTYLEWLSCHFLIFIAYRCCKLKQNAMKVQRCSNELSSPTANTWSHWNGSLTSSSSYGTGEVDNCFWSNALSCPSMINLFGEFSDSNCLKHSLNSAIQFQFGFDTYCRSNSSKPKMHKHLANLFLCRFCIGHCQQNRFAKWFGRIALSFGVWWWWFAFFRRWTWKYLAGKIHSNCMLKRRKKMSVSTQIESSLNSILAVIKSDDASSADTPQIQAYSNGLILCRGRRVQVNRNELFSVGGNKIFLSQFFSKSENAWTETWSIIESPFAKVISLDGKRFFGLSDDFCLAELKTDDRVRFVEIGKYNRRINDVIWINANGVSCLFVTNLNEFLILNENFQVNSVHSLSHFVAVACIASLAGSSKFAIGTVDGRVFVFEIESFDVLTLNAKIPLSLHPIQAITFVEGQRNFIVLDEGGDIFNIDVSCPSGYSRDIIS